MKMNKIVLITMLSTILFGTSVVYAQDYRSNTRKGNKAYNDTKYADAEILYRKALVSDSTFYKAQYNMGDALYKQKQYDGAIKYYNKAIENPATDSQTKSNAHYNVGNSYLQSGLEDRNNPQSMEKFKNAISSYSEALKINPNNEDAKYNLSYARKMLKQMQQQQQQQNQQQQQQNQDQQQQNQDQQQQQNQDNKNQDKDKQNKEQENQQQQHQQNEQNNDKQKENKPQNADKKTEQKKKDAERILEAVKNNEKKTLDKQKQKNGVRIKGREKDW